MRDSVPAVTENGFLFFLANDSKLYLLDGENECLSTRTNPFPNRDVRSPVISPTGTIYIAGIDTLNALRGEHPLASSQWPMLQGNPAHTASLQEDTIAAIPVISMPAPGSEFRRSSPILIEARMIGNLAPQRVLFFANGELIYQTSQPPYQTIWSPLQSSPYTLSAVALNADGIERESGLVTIIVNDPPTISLRTTASPPIIQEFRDVTVIADASDTDGEISRVEFRQDSTLVAKDIEAPFEFTMSHARAGTYTFQAQAIDNLGSQAESEPFSVRVNARPTVTIESPLNGDSFERGQPLRLHIATHDTDSNIQRVEYFNREQPLGSTSEPPFSVSLFDLLPGKHVLLARAIDETHVGPFSDPVTISITEPNQKAQASFLQPTDRARFVSGQKVDLTVVGSDADGQIQNLIVSANDRQIATFTGPGPHTFQWLNVLPNQYRLTLEATDDDDERTLASISILVGEPYAPTEGSPPRPITLHPVFPGADGPIHTITESGGIIYLGGEFSYLGQNVTGQHAFDLSTDQLMVNHPTVNGGTITTALDDGHGGYYVGGRYESIDAGYRDMASPG